MPRIRILVTTRPENCALRAVRQGPHAPNHMAPGALGGTTKITILRPPEGARQPPHDAPERRRATTRMDDRSSALERYRPRGPASRARRARVVLLDLDGGAGALEGLGGLLGGVLGDLLENGLRGAVHEVLGLLQAQRGQLTHDLDDLDLLLAGAGEDDVELVLLLSSLDGGGRTGRAGNGDRGGGGDVELLLERLHELGELDEGHALELGEQFVLGESHDGFPSTNFGWCRDVHVWRAYVRPAVTVAS